MKSVERRVLSGDIDLSSGDALSALFGDVPNCDELVIDMLGVRFIDSAGLSRLIEVRRRLRSQCGAAVRIIVADPHVHRVFRVCGLDKIFEIDLVASAAAS
jgi:anti-anti-sigma factor